MDRQDKPEPADVAALVRSAATAATLDAGPRTSLVHRCWPGGEDRLQPAALEWVRRWGPHRVTAPAATCACASRRCAWCN